MGETQKAHKRRLREGFYDLFHGSGIDIGCGEDAVPVAGVRQWDKEDGDATLMQGVKDSSYDWVYTSHVLEHLSDPESGLKNWYRILHPGGLLFISLPHRDLYERKKALPSRWNLEHKFFWLPWNSEAPSTKGLLPLLLALGGFVLSIRVCMDGWGIPADDGHSLGEYSIEAIVRKPHK